VLLTKAQQKRVEKNLGLVGTVIKENVNGINNIGLFTYQDIFQIGCIGLSNAARYYNTKRGKFSTYAYKAIRNEIFNALNYASVRRRHEVVTRSADVLNMLPAQDHIQKALYDINEILASAKSRAGGVTAKGIDAIVLLAEGYSCRDIGSMMGGISANNISAWISKARVFLRQDPRLQELREAV